MADSKNSAGQRYAYLRRLSIEQLEELLRTAALAPEDQQTSDYYDAIEEVILKREKEQPTGRLSDIDSAWREFQQQYASPEGRGQRLYPDEESEVKPEQKRRAFHGIFRKAGLIAATIAVLFACMAVAQAAGLDVFGALARWTGETFHFENNSNVSIMESAPHDTENEIYHAIKKEADQMDISISAVPTWFPEGFQLQDIQYADNGTEQSIDCLLKDESEQLCFFSLSKYNNQEVISHSVFEKDDSPVVEYISCGKLFYIMSNLENRTAAWSGENLCIAITGPFDEDTIKKIIDSIGE